MTDGPWPNSFSPQLVAKLPPAESLPAPLAKTPTATVVPQPVAQLTDTPFVQQPAAQVTEPLQWSNPWGHHVIERPRVSDPAMILRSQFATSSNREDIGYGR